MMQDTNNNGSSTANGTPTMNGAPEPLAVYGPRPAVTRISRRAVVLVGVAGVGLTLVVLAVGSGGRATPDRQAGQAMENDVRPAGPIESVRDLPRDYTYEAQPAAVAPPNASRAAPATRATDPSPQDRLLEDQIRQTMALREQLAAQHQKELQLADESPLVFAKIKPTAEATRPESTAPAPPPTAPTYEPPPSFWRGGEPANPAGLGNDAAGQRGSRDAFLAEAGNVEPYLHLPLLRPASRFELKAGSVVPAALVTAINTDLPGDVIAQVTENVYDSATGDYLLVPQGSRLLGTYHSLVSNGQNRALLVWQRLIFPNGNSITLGGMPGIDEAGAAGVADRVDYHLDKLAAATALSTAIAYGGNLARNRQSVNGGYPSEDVIGDTIAQQADRIGGKIIDRQLDVQPTITIRQGWPLRVLVNKDIVLVPYASN